MTISEMNYKRTFEQLEQVASKFWPTELSEMEANLSVIPLLLKTQDQFIHVLSLKTNDLEDLFNIIEAISLPTNLFVKHLIILADFGGEMLKRVSQQFYSLFPAGTLNYWWQGQPRAYTFRALPHQKFSNAALKIDGKNLFKNYPLSDLQRDAIMLVLFGSAHEDYASNATSVLVKCELGNYLGKSNELTTFIKQRYIWVSRVTGGAQSNNLGQLAQKFVKEYLTDNLGLRDVNVQSNGRLPEVTHTNDATGHLTTFDLVVSSSQKYVAIEVCFQVTTNSVIERKAGQARARYEQIHAAGHKIAYVLDGAGNFERHTALNTLCAYSDCTVAFSRAELDVLCRYLQQYFTGETD